MTPINIASPQYMAISVKHNSSPTLSCTVRVLWNDISISMLDVEPTKSLDSTFIEMMAMQGRVAYHTHPVLDKSVYETMEQLSKFSRTPWFKENRFKAVHTLVPQMVEEVA